MSLPPHIFAPAFRRQRLNVWFTVLVGIMVYLATFATAGEAGLSAIAFTWDQNLDRGLTIELPATDDESSTPQAERVRQVVAILRAMPDVEQVTPVPEEDIARLLKPWIHQSELLKALPVPALIDVAIKTGSAVTAEQIEEHLKITIKDARVDDHAAWLSDRTRFVRGLSVFGGLMILLTAVTLAIAVGLICRVLMANERETILLLHTMGAEDGDIARHFQFHARGLSRPAAATGFACAIVSASVLLFFLRRFADPTLLQPLHWIGLAALVLVVPFAAVGIAAASARRSALTLLQAMP